MPILWLIKYALMFHGSFLIPVAAQDKMSSFDSVEIWYVTGLGDRVDDLFLWFIFGMRLNSSAVIRRPSKDLSLYLVSHAAPHLGFLI